VRAAKNYAAWELKKARFICTTKFQQSCKSKGVPEPLFRFRKIKHSYTLRFRNKKFNFVRFENHTEDLVYTGLSVYRTLYRR